MMTLFTLNELFLAQYIYNLDLLKRAFMKYYKLISTPLSTSHKIRNLFLSPSSVTSYQSMLVLYIFDYDYTRSNLYYQINVTIYAFSVFYSLNVLHVMCKGTINSVCILSQIPWTLWIANRVGCPDLMLHLWLSHLPWIILCLEMPRSNPLLHTPIRRLNIGLRLPSLPNLQR